MMCSVCKQEPAAIGLLCPECRDELVSIEIAPEQIEAQGDAPTVAAFVDAWGRPHRVELQTAIGRSVGGRGFAILESSVSRQHALIALHRGTWMLRDLGSANGTYVEDRLVEPQPVALATGDRVRFGEIAFYFLEDVGSLPAPRISRTISKTLAPPDPRAQTQPIAPAVADAAVLRPMVVRMHEPTGGGGAMIAIDGKAVQLTTPQFELFALLVARMTEEADVAPEARGFVKGIELLDRLSWDADDPNDDHVRQLVRRVRRLLRKAGLDEVIESRPRLGYRLRLIPA